ncbi:S24 family peptidase [Sphingomonas sp.]|uniref:S24 family peptidase n=1 Tax=Sphingomonas sp. TaxID=28214 RepID=UPI002DD64496|nr:S24 family peptidase [Sphingomonas sp.]
MDEAGQRAALTALIAREGATLATLSRVAGRNSAWMQQYLRRGTPRLLPERERGLLAAFLGVADSALGGPEPAAMVRVPRLALAVSAGPGRFAIDERAVASAGYAAEDLDRLGIRAGDAAILDVAGQSMEPTLHDGDRILVDRGRCVPGDDRAIWVLRLDDELLAKRLRRDGDAWRIVSDNAPERRAALNEVEVLGRVVQLIRRL